MLVSFASGGSVLDLAPEGAGDGAAEGAAAEGGVSSGGDGASQEGGAEDGAKGEGAAADGQKEPPAYAPNFKFKYRAVDKENAEGEVDPLFRSLVKDADTEKKIRELHEKAYGIDFVKHDRDQIRQELEPLRDYRTKTSAALQRLGAMIQQGDMESFITAMKIPPQLVLQYALDKIKYAEMTPEQRAAYDSQRQQRVQASQLELENQNLQNTVFQIAGQQRGMEVEFYLQRPEISEAATAYDGRIGKQGAFKELVFQRGAYHYYVNKVDKPVNEVVSEVLQMLGHQTQSAGGQPVIQPTGGTTTPASVGSKGKPVIPNIQGKGTSPAKVIAKSTDELRKLANQYAANDL